MYGEGERGVWRMGAWCMENGRGVYGERAWECMGSGRGDVWRVGEGVYGKWAWR